MSKSQILSAAELRDRLKRAVEKKKKENKIVPLLERLFDFHVDISFLEPLINRTIPGNPYMWRKTKHKITTFKSFVQR